MRSTMDSGAMGTVSRSLLDVLYEEYLKTQPLAAAPLEAFIEFGNQYLVGNRPVELFHADQNYGLRLANNELCLVAPPTAGQHGGDMQPNTAIKV